MYIERIEIQYFRSIYRETISGLRSLNIFTGKNDVGKSNVLKALNLFFNNETEPGVPFRFSENFNLQRLQECKDSVKGKQFIQIKITFARGARFEKTLPPRFTVTKKWFRTDTVPSIVADDLARELGREGGRYTDRNKSSLTTFLNRIRYLYIPAIKDSDTFQQVLALLRESIYHYRLSQDKGLEGSMRELAAGVAGAAKDLNEEFQEVTGIKTHLSTPKSISELYQTIIIDTLVDGRDTYLGLDRRGDGIRIRYLPSILHYISKNSQNYYIWGFEEPENSLEYSLAMRMAEDFRDTYCRGSQILVTSHSPAFIGLGDGASCALYRCFRDKGEEDGQEELKTRIVALSQAQERDGLAVELGYVQIQKEIYASYKEKLDSLERAEAQRAAMERELAQLKQPVLYTEGKTDAAILTTAWEKLYGDAPRPFEIKSCNTLEEQDGSAGGCAVLQQLLCTARPDSPQVMIGLFDRDPAGIRAYSLSNNFEEIEPGWKRHKNKKANGILLPVPPGKEDFARYHNLSIEFYFEKDDLETRVDGKGLKLCPFRDELKFHGVPVQVEPPRELYLQQIEPGTKVDFAERVVPSLPEVSFVHFRLLFKTILKILDLLQPRPRP